MTVSTTSYLIQYAGNGSTTAFATGFEFIADTDLVVILTDSSGVDTTQVITTNYTVAGAGVDAGGTVTMLVPPASGETLTIYRNTALTQGTDYTEFDPFPADSHEQAIDKLTMISQETSGRQARSIQFRESEDRSGGTKNSYIPSPDTGKFLGWDANGNLVNQELAAVTYDLTVSGGDAGKVVVVNGTEDGIESTDSPTVATPASGGKAANKDYVDKSQRKVAYMAAAVAATGVTASASTQEGTGASGLAFSSDGTKMYVTGDSNSVFQYTLSTAGDLSTASYASKSADVSGQCSSATGVAFNSDGTIMYVGDGTTIYQYTLSTAWDVSTASYASKSLATSAQDAGMQGRIVVANSDTHLYVTGTTNDYVYRYSMTAGDLSTASFDHSLDVSATITNPQAVWISSDGYDLWVLGGVANSNNAIYRYHVPTAFDLTSADYDEKTPMLYRKVGSILDFSFIDSGNFIAALEGNATINELSSHIVINKV